MKIVHIITRLIIGGAQENTLLSCEGQHDLGHDVTLITGPALGPEGSLMERARGYGYRVEVLDEMRRSILPARDFRSYARLKRMLAEMKPDVVHTHSSKAGIVGRWAARAARVPVILHTLHGLAFTASTRRLVNGVYRSLEKITAPISTRIVCVADAMREQSLAEGIGRPDQYVTVYSGMEIEPFVGARRMRDDVRRRLGIQDDEVVVGTIARLFHLKGHDDLLEHAPQMCSRFPRLRFLWVGDGLLRRQFEQAMERMGLRDRFILTGMVKPDEVPQYVGAMDLLVHPSRREGLARALPQGQLAGIPVVAYDVDGNRDGFIDGESGILVPAFEIPKLVAAVERLAADAELRAGMGARGRAFAIGRFDRKVMVDELDKLYRQCLSEQALR